MLVAGTSVSMSLTGGLKLGKTLTWRITMAKLDAYEVKRHFVLVQPSMSGADFSLYVHAKWNDQHHGVKIKGAEELRELYELFGSILFNYDHEMDLKLLKPPLGKEPF
jgi:hypothetical protein